MAKKSRNPNFCNPSALKYKMVDPKILYKIRPDLKNSTNTIKGLCDWKNNTVYIDKDLTGLSLIETEIHESIHAINPNLKEEEVEKLGEVLSYLLYEKLGYRK